MKTQCSTLVHFGVTLEPSWISRVWRRSTRTRWWSSIHRHCIRRTLRRTIHAIGIGRTTGIHAMIRRRRLVSSSRGTSKSSWVALRWRRLVTLVARRAGRVGDLVVCARCAWIGGIGHRSTIVVGGIGVVEEWGACSGHWVWCITALEIWSCDSSEMRRR
jgi:hypothetical protein